MLPHEHALSQRVVEFLVAHVDGKSRVSSLFSLLELTPSSFFNLDFSALLESRLKENPYRRGVSSQITSLTSNSAQT